MAKIAQVRTANRKNRSGRPSHVRSSGRDAPEFPIVEVIRWGWR
jgi:hypothetical protein